ncbi:MAG: SAM-dependent chlorinase/fluorinase [Actinomycetota bacterium]|nr:SAM-dependent chlorinase/fluorinase [Actinomycetota bacterium]
MGSPHHTVSFLSDYGYDDEFAGVVKSVIRSVAPQVTVVDVTHGVPPHDVRAGALTLVRAVQYLVPGVVLAIVDPGVGTERRAVAVEAGEEGEAVFVGPDNGLLASAVAMAGGATRAVELANPAYQLPAPGATFAGRDVFGPAAGHLCNGVDLDELGPAVDPITLRPGVVPLSRQEGAGLVAEVLWVDRFGNVQLNVGPDDVDAMGSRLTVRWGAGQVRTARRAGAYGELGSGEMGLVVDSYGLMSLAFDRRPAAEELGLRPGDAVTLEPPS